MAYLHETSSSQIYNVKFLKSWRTVPDKFQVIHNATGTNLQAMFCDLLVKRFVRVILVFEWKCLL